MSTLSVVLLPDACLAAICCNQLNSPLCVLSFFVFALWERKKKLELAPLAVAQTFCCLFGALMNWRTLCFRLANISKHFANHNIVYIYMSTDRARSEIKIEKGRPVFMCVCARGTKGVRSRVASVDELIIIFFSLSELRAELEDRWFMNHDYYQTAKLYFRKAKKRYSSTSNVSQLNRKLFVWFDWCNIGRFFLFLILVWFGASHTHTYFRRCLALIELHIYRLPSSRFLGAHHAGSTISIREFTRRRMEMWTNERKNHGTFPSQNFEPFGTHLEFLNHFPFFRWSVWSQMPNVNTAANW